ncbi:MAG: hypothetical protein KAR11_00915 [Phycisphaerae bacterium]|nr:hypothetical protein [Phycisphaerae bacterium]
MNILTKICVVLLLVTSLVACVVFVNMATVQPNYKYYYEQEKLKTKQHANSARSKTDTANRSTQELTAAKKKHADAVTDLKLKKHKLELALTEAKREISSLKSNLTSERGSLSGLNISQKSLVKTNDNLRKDLKNAIEAAHKKSAAAIKFETMFKKSEAEKELLERQVSVLQDRAKRQKAQSISLSRQIQRLEQRYGHTAESKNEADPLAPAQRVTGAITAIKDNLASVNLGSNSGMKVGMKLIISRGPDYVGMLKLEKVDVNEAAGILMDGNPMSPQKGDKVTTKLD